MKFFAMTFLFLGTLAACGETSTAVAFDASTGDSAQRFDGGHSTGDATPTDAAPADTRTTADTGHVDAFAQAPDASHAPPDAATPDTALQDVAVQRGDAAGCSACQQLAGSYRHFFDSHIVPTAAGTNMGFTNCTLQLSGDMVRDSNNACSGDGCGGSYSGTVDTTATDCSNISSSSDHFAFGLNLNSALDLSVWEYSTMSGTYELIGDAIGDGQGGYTLVFDEQMGSGSFSLGTNTKTYRFVALP